MSQPRPQSVISIDIGHRRIGLAGCDPLGITICRLSAIHRKSFIEDTEILKKHCLIRKAEGLVIGLPLDKNGFPTKQTKFCKNYGYKLAKALDLPIAWVNEQCSTWAAKEKYNLRSDRTGQLDSAAAALLLDQWLKEGPELKPVHMPAY